MSSTDLDGTSPRPVPRAPDDGPGPPGIAPRPQTRVLLAGLLGALTLGAVIGARSGATTAVLFGLGLALGFVLFHSRFGFSSAWRQLVAVRQGRAVRAQLVMLGVACTLCAPILATGTGIGGARPGPYLGSIGVGLFVGSFVFGVGMQLAGSCSSGTLFALGGGQTVVLPTLGGFLVGAVLATRTATFWSSLPALAPVSLADTPAGYAGAWLLTLAVLTALWLLTRAVGRGRTVPPAAAAPVAPGPLRAVRGAWPLGVGAVLIGVLEAVTLAVSGRPWGITYAFSLWGAKLLDLLGFDVASWDYWSSPGNAAKYHAGVLGETSSVMDLGIVLGALVASAAAGTWVLHRALPPRLVLGAVVGGVLMGYGARIAYGCNIGAYLGGIASFSLHGWLWGVMALVGTFAGLALRPLFGLNNPKPTDSVC